MAGTADPVGSTDTGNVWLQGIMWGTQWDSGAAPGQTTTITYAIAGQSGREQVDLDGRLNDYVALPPEPAELAAMDAAMDAWAAVCDIEFVATGSQADADVIWVTAPNWNVGFGGALGVASPPGTATGGANGAQSPVAIAHDQYSVDLAAPGALAPGSFDAITFTHELGHALGLAHPHDDGGGSSIFPGVSGPFDDYGDYGMNQGLYTIMSYNDGFPGGPLGPSPSAEWGYEIGPMALDIAAMQAMYGANMATGAGDDTYRLPTVNDVGTGYACIWDAGGHDTIRGGAGDDVIDLRAATLGLERGGGGWLSSEAGIFGGFTIAHGVVLEDATGAGGADRLVGNDAANALWGGGGDDSLSGADGDDVLKGEAGADALSGGLNADKLKGGDAADALTGGNGGDVLQGEDGSDTLSGGQGADRLNGGDGHDTFVFASASHSDPGAQDLVLDFRRGADRIDLSAIDADPSSGGDQDLVLDAGGAFAAGEVRQTVRSDGLLIELNLDADKAAEMAFVLKGLSAPLQADSFLL